MKILEKIQNLPKRERKIILWSVVMIIGIFLFISYIKNFKLKIKNFSVEEMKNQFSETLKEWPKIEIPKIEVPEIRKTKEDQP